MPYYRDDWDEFLAHHENEFWQCGVPDHILRNKGVFLGFLREGHYQWGATRASSFEGSDLSDDQIVRLADVVAQHIDIAYRESILSRWRMARLRPVLESTCWVRYFDSWQEGREALTNDGLDLEKCVFFYNGPGGSYATVGFVEENGKVVRIDLERDTSNGSVYIGERWSEDDADDRNKDVALEIWESGQLEWFNGRVRDRLRQHHPEVDH